MEKEKKKKKEGRSANLKPTTNQHHPQPKTNHLYRQNGPKGIHPTTGCPNPSHRRRTTTHRNLIIQPSARNPPARTGVPLRHASIERPTNGDKKLDANPTKLVQKRRQHKSGKDAHTPAPPIGRLRRHHRLPRLRAHPGTHGAVSGCQGHLHDS